MRKARDVLIALKEQIALDKDDRLTHLARTDDPVESAKLRGEIRYASSLLDQMLAILAKGVD